MQFDLSFATRRVLSVRKFRILNFLGKTDEVRKENDFRLTLQPSVHPAARRAFLHSNIRHNPNAAGGRRRGLRHDPSDTKKCAAAEVTVQLARSGSSFRRRLALRAFLKSS